ncbi:MAG: hypothetical protein OEO20_10875 [Gemmatimonadota bacterium]|nr:hypothetical protein [Gemmatimonadota bacterium]MDH3478795.1 hypothetical protein [Gemmatimonadota bacterium]MDH3568880.1 hypothetical protein [Gemmatimonadota bacterium]MDH5548320.1 hypothetical protein [Gemmatimonadota bacterium]
MVILTELRDSLDARNAASATDLQEQLDQAGGGQNPRALMTLIRPSMDEARTNAQRTLERVQAILTPAQFDKLPEDVRSPAQGRQPSVGRRPGDSSGS